jgi:hypothetical protein
MAPVRSTPSAAASASIRCARPATGVGLDTDVRPEPLSCHVPRARDAAWTAGRHQQHVDPRRGLDQPEGQAVARGERDGAAGSQGRRDVAGEGLGDDLVGQQDEAHIEGGGGGQRQDREAVRPRGHGVLVVTVADGHVHARVAQIERRGPAEVAIAEDGHTLTVKTAHRRVGGAKDLERCRTLIRHQPASRAEVLRSGE